MKTILIVDDHRPTREAYATFLREHGYLVVEAAHGGEAILAVHHHRPDLVLMDIVMPVLDGVETAESLRGCTDTVGTPILAVTGSASAFERARMLACCDDLLLKPCAPEEIATRIRSLVEVAA